MASVTKSTIVVLDPTAPPRDLRHDLAERLAGLGGRTVGFLWNSKPNGDILFNRLEQLLREKYEIADVVYRRKPTASLGATEKVLEELAASADAVVIGLGD